MIDLRAHFEAQLRTVARAEETLLKCRGAHDAATFDAAATTLRAEVRTSAGNRRSAGHIVEQVVADARKTDVRELTQHCRPIVLPMLT